MSARQATWERMCVLTRDAGSFSVRDVRGGTGFRSDTQVRAFVEELCGAGHVVETTASGTSTARMYRVARRSSIVPPPGGCDTQTANLWRTIRMLKAFSTADLQIAASTEDVPVTLPMTQRFLSHLVRAGYLTLVTKARAGRSATYQLKAHMNTGPKAPVIRKVKEVFDPNREQVVWREIAL